MKELHGGHPLNQLLEGGLPSLGEGFAAVERSNVLTTYAYLPLLDLAELCILQSPFRKAEGFNSESTYTVSWVFFNIPLCVWREAGGSMDEERPSQ